MVKLQHPSYPFLHKSHYGPDIYQFPWTTNTCACFLSSEFRYSLSRCRAPEVLLKVRGPLRPQTVELKKVVSPFRLIFSQLFRGIHSQNRLGNYSMLRSSWIAPHLPCSRILSTGNSFSVDYATSLFYTPVISQSFNTIAKTFLLYSASIQPSSQRSEAARTQKTTTCNTENRSQV